MNNITKAPVLIIPARGGSKRLPRKNILKICGKPLIAYVIEAALESNVFSEIIVSTEDNEIASVASSFGVIVHHRRNSLAGDRSTVVQVCSDVLQGKSVDFFCCIYPTSALLTVSTIVESFNRLNESGCDFLMGVSEYNFPPEQALRVGDDGRLSMMWPEYQKIQSQFYSELCVSNGSLYWAKRSKFLEEKTFYGKNLMPFFVPVDQVSDVNTKADFDKLESTIRIKVT